MATIRILSYNIHKGLTPANRRFVLERMRTAIRSVDAEVVFLQEVQGQHHKRAARFADWPIEGQCEYLADSIWSHHAYGKNALYDHGHHGNAILSRFGFVSFSNEDVSDHRYERRGLLHSVVAVPGWRRNLHCVCVHLSLHQGGRNRQLEAISGRLQEIASHDLPIVVAGDFNDWRHRATSILERRLGMTEVSVAHAGRAPRTYPSLLPLLRLDRIYVRGFDVAASRVHGGRPWSMLSDHLAVSAELRRG